MIHFLISAHSERIRKKSAINQNNFTKLETLDLLIASSKFETLQRRALITFLQLQVKLAPKELLISDVCRV